jgi:hypothetical protein
LWSSPRAYSKRIIDLINFEELREGGRQAVIVGGVWSEKLPVQLEALGDEKVEWNERALRMRSPSVMKRPCAGKR